ncbi:MAG: hypothetical protein U0325_05830 [Polyangiales bacterium]
MTTSVTVPPPVGLGRDTRQRAAARATLAATLWDAQGRRRLPDDAALVAALEACDPRDVWWVCEASSAGPVYLLPTREWVAALADHVRALAPQRVLEVGAGDGFLAACLAAAVPAVEVVATDSFAWRRPAARMSDADRAAYPNVSFAGISARHPVAKMAAVTAVTRYQPDLVIVCWPPPGALVERVIRAPCGVVLEIGVEGDVTGDAARTWRYAKEFLDGPLQDLALCRLDARPSEGRATRVTAYYGRRHPEHGRTDV